MPLRNTKLRRVVETPEIRGWMGPDGLVSMKCFTSLITSHRIADFLVFLKRVSLAHP